MSIVGAAVGVGLGRTLMRAVSFLGPRFTEGVIGLSGLAAGTGRSAFVSGPGGLGNGWRSGDVLAGGTTGGRRGKNVGDSVVVSAAGNGVIFGGPRVGGPGGPGGRKKWALSRFSPPEAGAPRVPPGGGPVRPH